MRVFNHDVGVLIKKTFHEIMEDNILGLSAETAYNFFFGLFPLLLFAAPLMSLVGNKEALFDAILTRVGPTIPQAALSLLLSVLHDVVFTPSAPGLISVGALLSLWAGAGLFSSLMSALNVAFDVTETRPWWKQKLIAIVCAIGAVIILLSSTLVMIAGEQIVGAAARWLHLGAVGTALWTILQYALACALVVLFIALLYRVLPNLEHGSRFILPGAIVAALLWALFTIAFRLYVTNFGSYNKTYGTIGGVIVLLTWMYWSMFAILAGGELNSELHAGTGASTGAIRA